MAVRPTMAALIARARLLTADPAGAAQLFTDQDIQDKLDECRTDLWQALLTPRITFTNPGGMLYLDYYYIPGGNPRGNPVGFFEDGAVLVWGDFSVLTPATSDLIVGHWTFASTQLPPVLIRGRHFDLYRASADLLDEKIANMAATTFDFTADGRTMRLSQILDRLEKMRDTYRRKQRAVTHPTARLDMAAGESDTGGESGVLGIQPRQAEIAGPVSAGVPFLTGE